MEVRMILIADFRIPYQRRLANHDLQQQLEQELKKFRWLLILGRTGLGKTREAAELAQRMNQEGWTILWLKKGEWLDEPSREQLEKIGTNRKLLFFLDDLNQRMYFAIQEQSPRAEKALLAPLNIPLQERMLQMLKAYEKFCGEQEVCVIATARNEKETEIPGEPSEWEKLKWEKYLKLWKRFKKFELREPEDHAIVQLLRELVLQSNIPAKNEDYLEIARRNDCTFRNIVENLISLKKKGQPLTVQNYRETLRANWKQRYQDLEEKYPVTCHIYNAVELLRQLNIPLEQFTIEPAAQLMIRGNFWQQLWNRWQIHRALNYITGVERILAPRAGQIEAKSRQIKVEEYIYPLSHIVLKLVDKDPEQMLPPLYSLSLKLCDLSHYRESLNCFEKILNFYPENFELWYYKCLVQLNLERYQEAKKSLVKALALTPEGFYAWYLRGQMLEKVEENYIEALNAYSKALELEPDFYDAWYSAGDVMLQLEDYGNALNAFDKGLALKPEEPGIWYKRGYTLTFLNRFETALDAYDRAFLSLI